MTFIIYLILINFFLFLPRYLFGLPKSWNPLAFLLSSYSIKSKLINLYFSRTIDPFRLSIEYSTLAVIIFSFGIGNFWSIGLLTVVGLLVFCFNIYLAVFTNFLHKTPVIKSDWLFLKNSVAFYKGYVLFIVVGLILLLVGLAYTFSFFNYFLSTLTVNILYNLVFLLFVFVFGFRKVNIHPLDLYMYRTSFSVILYFFKSAQYSVRYDHLLNLSKSELNSLNRFKDVALKKKPNIHIISMESYGSIIFKELDKYSQARKSLDKWNEKFQNSDILVRSSFAVPPLFATGTWYSYSTLLFGMTIDNGNKHDILFKGMANFSEYESLFQLTKREGYTNFLLHGFIGNFDDTLDYEKFKRNLNYDVLVHNNDLDYKGQLLDFMRMQKCPPDQFTLNKGLEIAKKNDGPYTFFYCTLNSHWDFYSPVEIIDNWKDLNTESYKFKTTADGNMNSTQKYGLAIDYTINSVFDSIMKQMNDNDIYIVYGDHQPTTLTDEKYGKETPMHIFSKNEDFLNEWENYGFKSGIIPEKQEEYIKFEAFYSALVSCLNKQYGEDTNLEIPFFKDGIRLE